MKTLNLEGFFFLSMSLGFSDGKQSSELSCLRLIQTWLACVTIIVLQIELSPVDFVSRVIVGLLQDVLHSGGRIFHIINPSNMDCW
jgi:hypothetical protein